MVAKVLNIFIILGLLQWNASALAASNYSNFSNAHVDQLNAIRTSSKLKDLLRQNKQTPPALRNYLESDALKKEFTLPSFTLKKNKLHFTFENQKYELSHASGSKYWLNRKLIDLDSTQWQSQFTPESAIESLLVPKAHALAPLAYFVIWGVVVLVASGCIVMSLGDQQTKSSFSAKWISSDPAGFNSAIRAIRQAYRKAGCGANADDLPGDLQYDTFYKQYCGSAAQKVAAAKLNSSSQKTWTGRELSLEEKIDAYIDDNESELGIGTLNPETAPKIKQCQRQDCPYVSVKEIPYTDQDILNQMTADSEFMKACIKNSLHSASATPTGTTERAQ